MATFAIVAASDFNAEDFSRRLDAGAFDHVLAVDGGFAHLDRIGIVPDVALGDFDSLGFEPQGMEVVRHPVLKDASDLELALQWCEGEDATEVFAYGCLGGRLDHTIAAVQVLAAASERGLRVVAVGASTHPGEKASMGTTAKRVGIDPDGGGATCLALLRGPDRLSMHALSLQRGGADAFGMVSLFSLTPTCEGVDATGFRWNLEGARLDNRTSLGLSNELMEPTGEVRVASGTLAVIFPAAFEFSWGR